MDTDDLLSKLDDTVAAMMMTNPNTVGIFERNIPAIAEAVHGVGALMYYDGANLNPLLGVARPGDMALMSCTSISTRHFPPLMAAEAPVAAR